MNQNFKVVYGIKLFDRKCEACPQHFMVPQSSPQVHCSEYCRTEGKIAYSNEMKPAGRRRKKGTSHKLTKEDYE